MTNGCSNMTAAALAAGYIKLAKPLSQTPPKLVRQTNRLSWQTELALNKFVVVSNSSVLAFDRDIILNGKEVPCPPEHTILVDVGLGLVKVSADTPRVARKI